MKKVKYDHKHLTRDLRDKLESYLKERKNFTEISELIKKDRTTVSKEIRLHRKRQEASSFKIKGLRCINMKKCNKFNCSTDKECFEEKLCPTLKKSPYVCNGCLIRTKCRSTKFYYYGKDAHNNYNYLLSKSREGFDITQEKIDKIEEIIKPLIVDKKQSVNHIYVHHKETLDFSKTSFYTYINGGIFSFRNIDLPRKVTYKVRKKNKETNFNIQVRLNRTYEDYLKFVEMNPTFSIVQMDTVEGPKESNKVLLTLLLKKYNLMLIFLLEEQTQECVNKVFDYLKTKLGISLFKKIFRIILTDNGHEFLDADAIENDENSNHVISLFYCDPGKAWQKGALEKNHEFIRVPFPKDTSFDNLNQDIINLLANNINNIYRVDLDNNSPYELALKDLKANILSKLDQYKINPDNVNNSNDYYLSKLKEENPNE